MLKSKRMYLIVLGYLVMLRIVLLFGTGLSIFNLGFLYDLVFIMFWMGIIPILIKKIKIQKVIYVFVIIINTVIAITDTVYYSFFDTFSSKASLGGINMVANGNIIEYNIKIPFLGYLAFGIVLLVIMFIVRSKEAVKINKKRFLGVAFVFGLQVMLFLSFDVTNAETRIDYYQSDTYLFESMYDRKLFSEKYGYYNYHALDFTRFKPFYDEDELFEKVNTYFEEKEAHTANDMTNKYNGYNVISILAETLETRFIDEHLTPNLFEMTNTGTTFDNYYVPVFQQGATCNSEYMSFTGLNAIGSNDWGNNLCLSYINNDFTYTVANQLNDIGYNTYYFHSGFEWFYKRNELIPKFGFDTVKFQEDLIRDDEEKYQDYDEHLDTQMMAFFNEYVDYTDPFYVNLLSYSMHGAYNQDVFNVHNERIDNYYPNLDVDDEIRNYMLKLIEFDNLIGAVMEKLESMGELDNTLFLIYPDHYPYMMDKETYSDYIGVDFKSQEKSRQELIIYATDMEKSVVHMTGSTKDVAPTLLNLVTDSGNFKYFMGKDLFSDQENYVIFSDLSITNGRSYLTIKEELYGENKVLSDFDALYNNLEIQIGILELQEDLLKINYFELLKNR
ncbi:alkaline phosphatase family protein [Candidatus Izimaplasma sp. ZiA1]|uniref:LTA synthase family protein n=1 Tax=Candidatus Izimoplasma sp. ZiA1 TaxID=2024899 RepID=UPI00143A2740